jgi:hypothetical protein
MSMAEVEIHTGHEHGGDDFGRGVGITVGVIGIVLAVVTIGSHRAHTAAVITRTEANDQWAFYQAKKLREHLLDVGTGLANSLAPDPSRVQALVEKFSKDRERYSHEAQEIQNEAKAKEAETLEQERRALRLDIGEGFLELGLVLSSLYFLSKRKFFPVMGTVAAVIGTVLGVAGLLA